jgi:glycosyltransferase involved in cell wall biosynthesis
MTTTARSFVSVVTPFFNSETTLEECIRSVLAQSHADFELVLADNQSTDGSSEVARDLAKGDSRVRYIHFAEHVDKTRNYNRALLQMSPLASYCKVVQADDYIYPSCLDELTKLALEHPSVGVVSARRIIHANVVDPPESLSLPAVSNGIDIARRVLTGEIYPFGSPTSVLYRADLVRARPDFYDEAQYLHDVDTIFELLRTSDFGFCPQVLTFTRRDSGSTYGRVTSYYPALLNQYIALRLRGRQFFSTGELRELLDSVGRHYYATMVRAIRREDRAALFEFHNRLLRDAGLRWEAGRLIRAAMTVGSQAARNRLGIAARLRA